MILSPLLVSAFMFKCKKCEILKESLDYERKRSEELEKRLIVMTQPTMARFVQPLSASDKNEFFGTSDQDEITLYDEDGDPVIVTRKEMNEIQGPTNG